MVQHREVLEAWRGASRCLGHSHSHRLCSELPNRHRSVRRLHHSSRVGRQYHGGLHLLLHVLRLAGLHVRHVGLRTVHRLSVRGLGVLRVGLLLLLLRIGLRTVGLLRRVALLRRILLLLLLTRVAFLLLPVALLGLRVVLLVLRSVLRLLVVGLTLRLRRRGLGHGV